MSTIGIIFSSYAADNLFVLAFNQSFALQLVPEAKIVYDDTTSSLPFKDNYFCITVGLLMVFFISLVIFAFDFEKESWF
jgi:hypothetical protein